MIFLAKHQNNVRITFCCLIAKNKEYDKFVVFKREWKVMLIKPLFVLSQFLYIFSKKLFFLIY